MIISLDGIDGCGKSTQIKMIKNILTNMNYRVIETSRHNSDIGKFISVFLKNSPEKIPPHCLAALIFAEGIYREKNELKKLIEDNTILLSDRNIFSAYAYNSAMGIDDEWTRKLFEPIELKPDVAIIINTSPNVACQRKKQEISKVEKGNYFGSEQDNFIQWQKKIRAYFQNFSEKDNVYIVNGENSIEDVNNEIMQIILKKLKNN